MVEDTPWLPLSQDASFTVQHCNNGDKIVAATDIIQQTMLQLYHALHDRAKLLANSAQFDAALRDASAMIHMQPTVGLGYLCQGDVYCLQGRYAAALPVYDNGLQAVSSSDPYYKDLLQQRMSAMRINNKRIDFVGQLPVDIISTYLIPRIMPVLLSTGCCPYLHVSRTWQQRLSQHAEDLSFEVDYQADSFKNGHKQLMRFAPYVKSLDGTITKQKRLVDLLSRAHFSSLNKLKLHSK